MEDIFTIAFENGFCRNSITSIDGLFNYWFCNNFHFDGWGSGYELIYKTHKQFMRCNVRLPWHDELMFCNPQQSLSRLADDFMEGGTDIKKYLDRYREGKFIEHIDYQWGSV